MSKTAVQKKNPVKAPSKPVKKAVPASIAVPPTVKKDSMLHFEGGKASHACNAVDPITKVAGNNRRVKTTVGDLKVGDRVIVDASDKPKTIKSIYQQAPADELDIRVTFQGTGIVFDIPRDYPVKRLSKRLKNRSSDIQAKDLKVGDLFEIVHSSGTTRGTAQEVMPVPKSAKGKAIKVKSVAEPVAGQQKLPEGRVEIVVFLEGRKTPVSAPIDTMIKRQAGSVQRKVAIQDLKVGDKAIFNDDLKGVVESVNEIPVLGTATKKSTLKDAAKGAVKAGAAVTKGLGEIGKAISRGKFESGTKTVEEPKLPAFPKGTLVNVEQTLAVRKLRMNEVKHNLTEFTVQFPGVGKVVVKIEYDEPHWAVSEAVRAKAIARLVYLNTASLKKLTPRANALKVQVTQHNPVDLTSTIVEFPLSAVTY